MQNLYNVLDRRSEEVLDYCEREGLGFIPYCPIATGELAGPGRPAGAAGPAGRRCTGVQLALAWLLRRSPVMLPIPGTGSVAHLEENVGAAQVELHRRPVRRAVGARRPELMRGQFPARRFPPCGS